MMGEGVLMDRLPRLLAWPWVDANGQRDNMPPSAQSGRSPKMVTA